MSGKLAEWTGLEPATPGVTGRYSNQLNYHSVMEGADSATADEVAQQEFHPGCGPHRLTYARHTAAMPLIGGPHKLAAQPMGLAMFDAPQITGCRLADSRFNCDDWRLSNREPAFRASAPAASQTLRDES